MHALQKINELLHNGENPLYLQRSGVGTLARLACEAHFQGKGAVILTHGREDFLMARALLTLFLSGTASESPPAGKPVWKEPVLALPPMRHEMFREAWGQRLAALYALALDGARCLVASTESLLLRYVPQNFFDTRNLVLQRGMEFSSELILEQAAEWGYERVPLVTRPGDVARRGDILDIYPSGYADPVRLEFFGDAIEDLRLFDGETQLSSSPLDELVMLPVIPLTLEGGGREAAVRCEKLGNEGRISENDCYSLKKCIEGGGVGLLPGTVHEASTLIEDWLPPDTLWLLSGEADSADALRDGGHALKTLLEGEASLPRQPASLALRKPAQPAPWRRFPCVFAEPLALGVAAQGEELKERPVRSFQELFPAPGARDRPWQCLAEGLKSWRRERRQTILSFSSSRGRQKFLNLAEQDGIRPSLRYSPKGKGLFALVSPFRAGVDLEWDDCLILGEDIMYPRAERALSAPSRAFKGLDGFEGLKNGDLLVHRDYGIGRFAGLHHISLNAAANDFLLVEYAGKDKLYVPVDRLDLVQRFRGTEGTAPPLDRLGGTAWTSGKEKVRKAIEKIAADLVEMYAYRKVAKGFHYGPPDDLYHEFEATFGFEETPDQARAIHDVLADMDRNEPMDRLICGDVGFGKTEVALRAAFRAAAEGRQVALLCPTTVLAEQHYQTFRARLAGFPVTVGLLSRFVSRTKQKETLKAAEQGRIDILVGTHRILSNDVKLPNLALLILDEEQRFGVRHKERLKALKRNVDVLTLTATPIPRTLQLSMSGIRDLSVIETAPQDRKPVATAILRREDATLRKILEREIERNGQVFWVYNRVQGLERVAEYVRSLAPNARIGMAHGRMPEGELEDAMRKFWHGELDVLVCTSIVESGLDFPRANTLVVDQAQMFGLGQLYQLRGRVGRSERQAYAFLIVPDTERLSSEAEERLRVIMDMDYLGAGFRLAMEDLRLRGAGNILGEAQSGHMGRVGLDLYLEMLEQTVASLKGSPEISTGETEVNLGLPAHIPASYIEDGYERLRCYKSLSSARNGPAREEIALGMRDRFGPFPKELGNFLAVLDFKQFLGSLQVRRADIHADHVAMFWPDGQTAVCPEAIIDLAARVPGAGVRPPAGLIMPVTADLPLDRALTEIRNALESVRSRKQESSSSGSAG